jgi:hypothetical protein
MTSEDPMRVTLAAACLAFCAGTAFAQTGQAQPTDSPQSTGRLFASAIDDIKIVVRQPTPLLFDVALKLLPISLE